MGAFIAQLGGMNGKIAKEWKEQAMKVFDRRVP
jgi:hypothetical protein